MNVAGRFPWLMLIVMVYGLTQLSLPHFTIEVRINRDDNDQINPGDIPAEAVHMHHGQLADDHNMQFGQGDTVMANKLKQDSNKQPLKHFIKGPHGRQVNINGYPKVGTSYMGQSRIATELPANIHGGEMGPPGAGPPNIGREYFGPPRAGPPNIGGSDLGPPRAGPNIDGSDLRQPRAGPNIGGSDVGPPGAGPPNIGGSDLGPPRAGSFQAGPPQAGLPYIGGSDTGPPGAGLPNIDGNEIDPRGTGGDTDNLVDAILAGKKVGTNESSLPQLTVDSQCQYGKYDHNRYKCSLPSDLYEAGKHFDQMLHKTADDNKRIFLASVDSGYISMALNLYETSFLKHGITNFLFVCSDVNAKQELEAHGIACYYYGQDTTKTNKASRYMSKDFILKTHIKTKIILGALTLGYTVIITDVDIVFLKNPLQYFLCDKCDIEIQSDHTEENSGFYLVRPTAGAIQLHNLALKFGTSRTSNQKALKAAFKVLRRSGKIKSNILSKTNFPCGLYYFERPMRLFAGDNPCNSCVIVHNNWIAGKMAKIYRFKEHLMWTVDKDGYYSSTTTKYLMYNNYIDFGNSTRKVEVDTLTMALSIGYLLDRVVILPDFVCRCGHFVCKKAKHRRCPLHVILKVAALEMALPGKYREHIFLANPKVPSSVASSRSPVILIASSQVNISVDNENVDIFRPADAWHGATAEEIKEWFTKPPYHTFSILQFHSLYYAFAGLGESKIYKDFKSKLKRAIVKGNYRQY